MTIQSTIGPTRERRLRAQEEGSAFEEISAPKEAGTFYWKQRSPSALRRYVSRKELTERQGDAGYRFCEDWNLIGLEPKVVGAYADYISRGSISAVNNWTDVRNAAHLRFTKAVRAMGQIASNEVIVLCIEDKPLGRVGLEIARRGLTLLADHYGMPA